MADVGAREETSRLDGGYRPGPLTLRDEREYGGWRHYLDGKPVHAGTLLELQIGRFELGPGWLWGRYEWGFDPGRAPMLVVRLPAWEDRPDPEHAVATTELCLTLPAGAILRRVR